MKVLSRASYSIKHFLNSLKISQTFTIYIPKYIPKISKKRFWVCYKHSQALFWECKIKRQDRNYLFYLVQLYFIIHYFQNFFLLYYLSISNFLLLHYLLNLFPQQHDSIYIYYQIHLQFFLLLNIIYFLN